METNDHVIIKENVKEFCDCSSYSNNDDLMVNIA
jgi:hypothetical protein